MSEENIGATYFAPLVSERYIDTIANLTEWSYVGDWFVNEAGNSIFYVERNPCKCCPDSYFIEYSSPITKRKTIKFDVFTSECFRRVLKQYKLIKLECSNQQTECKE